MIAISDTAALDMSYRRGWGILRCGAAVTTWAAAPAAAGGGGVRMIIGIPFEI